MSIKKYVQISLLTIVVLVAAGVLSTARQLYSPTQGKKIGKYTSAQKALLVIDVQEDYTGVNGRQPPLFEDAEGQIVTINRLIEHASNSGMVVAYIRQIFDNNAITRLFVGRALDGLPGTELDSRIKIVNQNDFTKKNPTLFQIRDWKNSSSIIRWMKYTW